MQSLKLEALNRTKYYQLVTWVTPGNLKLLQTRQTFFL